MATPAFVAVSSQTGSTDPLTIPMPDGIEDDDIILLLVAIHGSSVTGVETLGRGAYAPTGDGTAWTLLDYAEYEATESTNCTVFWVRYDSGSTPKPTLPDNGDYTIARSFAFRGALREGTPVNKLGGNLGRTQAASMTHDIAANTSTGGVLVLMALTIANDNTAAVSAMTNTSLTDVDFRSAVTSIGRDGQTAMGWGTKALAGDAGDWVISSSNNADNGVAGFAFELLGDSIFTPDPFGIEVGINEPTFIVGADVGFFQPRLGIEVGFQPGLRFRTSGQRQVMLTGSLVETPEMTEGGTEGQVLTQHAKSPPTWEDASGGGGDTSLNIDLDVSGAHTVDRDDGATHDLTLTDDATLTPDATTVTPGEAIDLRVLIRQDGTGGHALDWGGTIIWAAGMEPTMPTDPAAVLTVGLVSVDDATTWYGYAGEDAPVGIEVAGGGEDVAGVSRIIFDGLIVTDDGGGQVTVAGGASTGGLGASFGLGRFECDLPRRLR